MQFLVGDIIYFSADDGSTGQELWAHNTSSHSTWRVVDIRSGSSTSYPGQMLRFVFGDTIYSLRTDGSTGVELWSHNTSSNSTSRVIDLNSGSINGIPTANYMNRNGIVVGDTIYFSAVDGSGTGMEMWAHDTSNDSTWRVTDINSGGWQMVRATTWRFLSATPFISTRTIPKVMEMSCGPTMLQMERHAGDRYLQWPFIQLSR